jgi:hypothetical protein
MWIIKNYGLNKFRRLFLSELNNHQWKKERQKKINKLIYESENDSIP